MFVPVFGGTGLQRYYKFFIRQIFFRFFEKTTQKWGKFENSCINFKKMFLNLRDACKYENYCLIHTDMKKLIVYALCGLMVFSGCGMSNLGKGSLIGSGAGAALGAGLGYLIGKDGKGAAIGAAIGTAVGGGTGALIGHKMDKKAEELAALEAAQVEVVEDVNGLSAIKVTFDSGILFDFNKATLKAEAKQQLDKFAAEMADMPDTDITVLGHTDNIGSAEANQKVSDQRALSVSNYLQKKGIAKERIIAEGHSYNDPVADNSTEAGRAQNRRVEIYISANENMIAAAENGTLQ